MPRKRLKRNTAALWFPNVLGTTNDTKDTKHSLAIHASSRAAHRGSRESARWYPHLEPSLATSETRSHGEYHAGFGETEWRVASNRGVSCELARALAACNRRSKLARRATLCAAISCRISPPFLCNTGKRAACPTTPPVDRRSWPNDNKRQAASLSIRRGTECTTSRL
jgi:hypothetical protein